MFKEEEEDTFLPRERITEYYRVFIGERHLQSGAIGRKKEKESDL